MLKQGSYVLPLNEPAAFLNGSRSGTVHANQVYVILQFNEIPRQEAREKLERSGVELLGYLPRNAYYARIPIGTDPTVLTSFGLRTIVAVDPDWKISPAITPKEGGASFELPDWSVNADGSVQVYVEVYPGLTQAAVAGSLAAAAEIRMADQDMYFPNLIQLSVRPGELSKIAELPFVQYIEPITAPEVFENYEARANHRSNYIASPDEYATGNDITGEGVVIVMGDDGLIGPHIDFEGRIKYEATGTNGGTHADHVAGTIFGAGNLNPKHKGMAYGADLIVDYGTVGVSEAQTYYNTDTARVITHSLGYGCGAGYDANSRNTDQLLRQYPYLTRVWSAGNSGGSNCTGLSEWRSLTGGYKEAKNSFSVGALSEADNLAGFSSRGPTFDGRIKPDVCAVGTAQLSTGPNNTYYTSQGTSMSAPGVAGVSGQIYQAYREQNGGQDPENAFVKGLLLHTADDLGNAGPDFRYGWGRINLRKALDLLSNNRYLSSTISQGDTNTHTITVTGSKSLLSVMVYWTDYEASSGASPALVNDIDIKLEDPSAGFNDPWFMNVGENPTTAQCAAAATTGVDTLNNMEQVEISSPAAGTYTVHVYGTSIPQGPQKYYLFYEWEDGSITVTYPNGGEAFVGGESERLRWDADGSSGNFTLEYSTDGGSSWNTISSTVGGANRRYLWTVPNLSAGNMQFRVSRGAFSDVSDTTYTIIDVPSNLGVVQVCPSTTTVNWDPVTGATGYEVFLLGSEYMESQGATTDTFFDINCDFNADQWWSVRALGADNGYGRRAVAVQRTAGLSGCTGATDDLELASIENPPAGTYQLCVLSGVDTVKVSVTNNHSSTLTNVPVRYQVNNGTVHLDTLASIASGATTTFTFADLSGISAAGTYTIKAWTDYADDSYTFNDTMEMSLTIVSGTTITLPYTEDFETFNACGTGSNCATENCSLGNDWLNLANGSDDDIDWRTDAGGTPSAGTGPGVDYSEGTASGKYLYLEASGGCTAQEAQLISPCIDLSGVSSPRMEFAYHMYGGDMGTLNVDVFADGSWTNGLFTISGDQGDAWFTQVVNLNAYAGKTILIRFRGITGANFESDVSLDYIYLYEQEPYINFDITAASYSEDDVTNTASCLDYRDLTVTMNIAQAPVGDADVTVSLGGTASTPYDCRIMTPMPIQFADGDGSSQTFVLRYFDDQEVEGNETIDLSFSIAGTTNAVAGVDNTMTITLVDDDLTPGSNTVTRLDEDWATGSYTTNGWTSMGSNMNLSAGNFFYNWNPRITNYEDSLTSAALDFRDADSVYVSYDIDFDNYDNNDECGVKLQWSEAGTSNWIDVVDYSNSVISGNSTVNYTANGVFVPSAAGLTIQLRFLFYGDDSYSIDNIFINSISAEGLFLTVASNVISTSTNYLGPNRTIHWYDASNQIIASIQNLSAHDYGCTEVSIDRTGTGGEDFNGLIPAQQLASKTFYFNPANNNSSGFYRVMLYYKEAEINGWETATGNNRSVLEVFKSPDPINSVTVNGSEFGSNSTLVSFGTDHYLQAEFSTGFSGMGVGADIPNNLPIELLSFEAWRSGKEVELQWVTETETNNEFFQIQRSPDGENFEGIGRMKGQGSSLEKHEYSFTDRRADTREILYYRLKQVDFDGTSSYSNIVAVDGLGGVVSGFGISGIRPNPFTDFIEIYYQLPEDGQYSVRMYDAAGKLVYRKEIVAPAGQGDTLLELDADLPSGTYFLKVDSDTERKVYKLVKQ